MTQHTDTSDRMHHGNDAAGLTSHTPELPLFGLKTGTVLVAVRPSTPDQAEATALSPNLESGLSQPRVHRLARRRLSRAAYALLEGLRGIEIGSEAETTYERLMRVSGFHSRTTISKALRELELLGIVTTRAQRANGRVSGLVLTYLGIPAAIPEPARQTYLDRARRDLENLALRARQVHRDIEGLERLGANQNANSGEAA